MKTLTYHCLLMLALVVSNASGADGEGRVIADWSQQKAGVKPSDTDHMKLMVRGDATAEVVDATTTPPTPLAENKPAVFIKSADSSRATLFLTPFSSSPLKGWIEMEVVIMNGKVLVIDLSQTGADQLAGDRSGSTLLTNIFLRPNNSILARSPDQTIKMTFLPKIEEAVPTTVRVAWDMTVQPPMLTFQVNGQDALGADSQPASFPLNQANPGVGVDLIRITPLDAFIGNIRVSE